MNRSLYLYILLAYCPLYSATSSIKVIDRVKPVDTSAVSVLSSLFITMPLLSLRLLYGLKK